MPSLHIHLKAPWRHKAQAGEVGLFNRLAQALPGWTLHFHPDTAFHRHLSRLRPGHSLFHKQDPVGKRALCLRQAYLYPFWRIERSNLRWEFDVARAAFTALDIAPADARRFHTRLRQRHLGTAPVTRDGFIFMPLQGHLLSHRSFQSMSPAQMIETTLEQDPRPIRATLHPLETCSPSERAALDTLQRRYARFQVVDTPSLDLLRACDMLVTQNSGMVLQGYLASKPAILFGQSDLHHIAGSVPRDGLRAAFDIGRGEPPDFVAYLFWFLRRHAINMACPTTESDIRARLAGHGWRL